MTLPTRLAALLASSLLLASVATAAEPAPPDLVGTWSWRSEGAMLVRGKDPGSAVHRQPGVIVAEGEVALVKQEGRAFQGTIKSKNATEPIVCAIGADGKTFSCADTDGYWDGRLVDADTIDYVYRHANAKSTVVAIGVMKRKR